MDQAVYLSYRIVDFAPVLVLVVDYVLMHLNHVNQLAVVVARPQAAVQQAPVQQPVAQETIQPQPPVGLHGLDALRHNSQPEPAQEQNPQYGNLNKPLDPSRLEQLRNNPNFFNPASFGRDEK